MLTPQIGFNQHFVFLYDKYHIKNLRMMHEPVYHHSTKKSIIVFSKACEYGIRAVLYVAEQSKEHKRVNIKDISKAIDSPEAYTAKILQQLKRDKIIESMKGPTGGFSITEEQSRVPLSKVVDAIDGDEIYRGCALGLSKCDEDDPCPLHDKFKAVREDLSIMLQSTSIEELAEQLKEGRAVLKLK